MIPRPSPMALRFFDAYVPRYLRRHFARVWLWGRAADVPRPHGLPVLFTMTHASWWDVMVGYHLARQVVGLEAYAPMDEAQLERYRVLARLGLYPVDRFSRDGMRRFLTDTQALLERPAAVWLTPQGAISSNRRRPLGFQAGVGHLVRRLRRVGVVPVAIEYEFLEEPRPEVFVGFGPLRRFEGPRPDARALTAELQQDLERELTGMQAALLGRDLRGFTPLLEGATSTSRVYDLIRAIRARLTGRTDPRRHGGVISDPRHGGAP